MLNQAAPRERLSPTGSLGRWQKDLRSRETVSAVRRRIAHICHDLRLPLTAILANAEFLTESTLSKSQRNEFYREIRVAIDRMNEMISSLLQCPGDTYTLRPTAQDIVDTVERAIRMTSVRRTFRRISIRYRHQGLAIGWFDSSRLEQVVANLILNACEAVSQESGQITISTTGSKSCLQIVVSDNGPGIPTAIQNAVFLPFVSYGKADGNGLGLAIAKKIVEDHGGEIHLDRRNDSGALFRITIPFAIPQGTTPLMS